VVHREIDFLETSFLITVKDVDLDTGLSILKTISKEFSISGILIQRGLGKHPQSPKIGGQIEDLRGMISY